MAPKANTDDAHRYCTNCEKIVDHSTPVNTSHSSTGESGCPDCLTATLLYVVEEIGDERTIAGGYVPESSRDVDGQITLAEIDDRNAGERIVDDEVEALVEEIRAGEYEYGADEPASAAYVAVQENADRYGEGFLLEAISRLGSENVCGEWREYVDPDHSADADAVLEAIGIRALEDLVYEAALPPKEDGVPGDEFKWSADGD